MNRAEACAVLEVFPACSDAELRAAYRRKVRYWHPDNFVASQEILPEMKRFAEEQMRRVIEAFTVLADTDCLPQQPEFSAVPQTLSAVGEPTEIHAMVQQIHSLTQRVRRISERMRTVSAGMDELTAQLDQMKHNIE